ncbi:26S proteasome non-ATPase regulatory subunit 7 [Ataeniobius toweri]|uniref:26S proteasome non-ATPase regulatory subunit 7 n=1 Tax=Ataeniobius toweri TaxID=208326 RepID=A0ABU7BIV5_9TELE|nr:26S proteasome non-ATPase regulatory subunit 7 [Ataeniobius toweri]
MPELAVENVVVHPLVLLSVVDHFNRIGKVGNQKRVVGVLLGSWHKKVLDVSNSFAVPFDEDDKDDSVWFLDHDYLENMYGMFKKVNARERIVGWYHTGPKLHKNDIAINELIKRYCTNSVLVIIDVKPKDLGLPTEAYISVEEIHDDGTPTSKTFEHITSEIGAEEAEEVGVEHLLRDIKDTTVGTLSQRITNQVHGLKGLNSKLLDIRSYLERVAAGKLPINHQIIYQLQDVFNLLPDVNLLVRCCSLLTFIYCNSISCLFDGGEAAFAHPKILHTESKFLKSDHLYCAHFRLRNLIHKKSCRCTSLTRSSPLLINNADVLLILGF